MQILQPGRSKRKRTISTATSLTRVWEEDTSASRNRDRAASTRIRAVAPLTGKVTESIVISTCGLANDGCIWPSWHVKCSRPRACANLHRTESPVTRIIAKTDEGTWTGSTCASRRKEGRGVLILQWDLCVAASSARAEVASASVGTETLECLVFPCQRVPNWFRPGYFWEGCTIGWSHS